MDFYFYIGCLVALLIGIFLGFVFSNAPILEESLDEKGFEERIFKDSIENLLQQMHNLSTRFNVLCDHLEVSIYSDNSMKVHKRGPHALGGGGGSSPTSYNPTVLSNVKLATPKKKR